MPAKGANAKKEGKGGKGKEKDDKGRGGKKEIAREVYVEGTLEKRCEGNLLRKWQTRYCVLTPKGLSYFKSKDELVAKKEPGTLIPVADFRNCAVNGLEIMLHAQSRTLVFRAGESQALPTLSHPFRSTGRSCHGLFMCGRGTGTGSVGKWGAFVRAPNRRQRAIKRPHAVLNV